MRSRLSIVDCRVLSLALMTVILTIVGCSSPDPTVNTGAVTSTSTGVVPVAEQNSFVNLLNEERAKRGYSPLMIDATLQNIATQYSGELAATNTATYNFAINGTDMATRLRNGSIGYNTLGHYGAIDFTTAQSLMNALAGNNSTLISDSNYNRIGVGIGKSAGHNYWTIVVID